VHVSIVFLAVTIVTRESLFRVRNIQTTVSSSLESTKDTASSSGGLAANIQETTEGTLVLINFIDIVLLLVVFRGNDFSVNFSVSLINIVQANLLQKTTSTEKTGAVSSGVVLQTDSKSVTAQLGGGGLGKDAITIDKRVGNLADNLAVGETNDKTVLWGLVLVLGLAYETLALTVVRLTLTTTTKLDLVARKVRLGLLNSDENLLLREGESLR
jgi:hypothetical protein